MCFEGVSCKKKILRIIINHLGNQLERKKVLFSALVQQWLRRTMVEPLLALRLQGSNISIILDVECIIFFISLGLTYPGSTHKVKCPGRTRRSPTARRPPLLRYTLLTILICSH